MNWYRLVDQAEVQQVDPITHVVLPERKTVHGKFAFIPVHGMYGSGKEVLVDACAVERIAKHNTRWTSNNCGYPTARSKCENRMVSMHQIIRDEAIPAGKTVDHLNQDKLDNRAINLAFKTRPGQGINQGKIKAVNGKPTSSKYKGVHFDEESGKWRAQIRIDGHKKYLGRFHCEEDARDAYRAAAAKRAREMEEEENNPKPAKVVNTIHNYFAGANVTNNS